MAGWIKLHRDIQNHWIWESSEVTYFQAWTDLLLNAAHKPHKQLIKKQVILLDAGQVAWSDSFMCNRWKWSRNKVRLFIKNLKKDGMIDTNTNHNKVHLTSIITICNYSTYQDSSRAQGTAKGTAQGTAGGTAQGTQDKNVKNDKNVNKTTWLAPEWINKEAWQEFEQHRKEINKPLSILAKTKATNTLNGFTPQEQQSCIDETIQNRWSGLFPKHIGDKNEENKRTGNNGSGKQSNHARYSQAIQKRIRDSELQDH